ncbi:hypothetical protein BgiBS90_003566 [Biomphalaria glabrata]|nr:hypothetical protein BgiBS90_003566 [Biomphalaria glabrata]
MSLLIMTSLKCSCTASPVVPEDGSFYCGKGTFVNRRLLYGAPFCDLCAEDTFIDSERHTFEYCEKCKQFEPWERVEETSPCTREHDTFIKRCESGFYPDTRPTEYGCRPCPSCQTKYISECCDNQTTVTVRSASEEHPTLATTSPNQQTLDLVTAYNTCEEIVLEHCHELNFTKCSTDSESKILCNECPTCQSMKASEDVLSTYAKIGIAIACFVVVVVVAIILFAVYKKRYQKYQPANTNNSSNNN